MISQKTTNSELHLNDSSIEVERGTVVTCRPSTYRAINGSGSTHFWAEHISRAITGRHCPQRLLWKTEIIPLRNVYPPPTSLQPANGTSGNQVHARTKM